MKTALTIGNFDGLHLGHQRLIDRVLEFSREHDLTPALLTFDPHPTKVVAPDRAPKLLTNLDRRKDLIHAAGIEHIEVLPFTPELAKLTPREFIEQILVGKLRARAVVVGDNFRFGNKAAGDVYLLKEMGREFGFDTDVLHAISWRGTVISSSAIRARVQAGDVSRACRMLGRPYCLEGEVVRGHGVGKKQTVPTLNLATQAEVLPAAGVYVTRTSEIGSSRRWRSVTNIGYRPTFGDDNRLSVETFLLDPLESATPHEIRVEFLKRLRGERKFESADALKAQILRDANRARRVLRSLEVLYLR